MHRKSPLTPFAIILVAATAVCLSATSARAQVTCFGDPTCIQPETGHPVGMPGTPNIELVSHLPLPGIRFSHADIEIEQEMSRPYAYIAQRFGYSGFYAISIENPDKPRVLYRWIIDDPDLHQGTGCVDIKYAKDNGRYYVVVSCQFGQGGPDADLGAVVFDVTGLPDASTVRKVAEIRLPDMVGGIHNIFTYRHSNGRALLAATTQSEDVFLYDFGQLGRGITEPVSNIRVPTPRAERSRQWHDMFMGYLPDAEQDRFYGAGTGGFHVFDVTDVENPRLLTTVTGIPGVMDGHTFTPTPDGRYAVGMPEPTYQHSPVRFFDLRPPGSGRAYAQRHYRVRYRRLDRQVRRLHPQPRGALAVRLHLSPGRRTADRRYDRSDPPLHAGLLPDSNRTAALRRRRTAAAGHHRQHLHWRLGR